jgi:large subunit ribosomal protein L21
MYAIVDIAGQQFKVEKEQEIFVHRLEGEAGSAVEFDHVLLLDNDGKVTVGSPVVNGALVKAKIIEHLKGDKVIVFHKKRRKGYQKQNGHRQYLSKLIIEDILASGAKAATKKKEEKVEVKETPKAEAKKEAKAEVKETPKVEAKKEVKKETKPEAKEAPKEATKKEAAPKAEVKETPKKKEKPVAEAKAKPEEKTEEQ